MVHPYATQAYAQVLARPGLEAIDVPVWRSSVLRRPIAGSAGFDATGCYPVTIIEDDVDVLAGLDALREAGMLSLVLVTDPYIRPELAQLESAFDFVRPFKTHYIREGGMAEAAYSKHHRNELARATAQVRRIDLTEYLTDWCRLYDCLVSRRKIIGMAAFSGDSFRRLAELPGLVSFGAFVADELVGAHLWIVGNNRVHSHLAATDEVGLSSGASYALYDAAIRCFGDVETIDFGGGAGLQDDPDNGLSRFKRGFANRTGMAYLCGKILNPEQYETLCATTGTAGNTYFPAYRGLPVSGEGTDV